MSDEVNTGLTDEGDIFGEVVDTEAPKNDFDPTLRLYNLPEDVQWFLSKHIFNRPKTDKECTKSVIVRFLSWQISEENQSVYAGTGVARPGIMRNQLIVRYHPIPDGYCGDGGFSQRVACKCQFGETCPWCTEKTKAEKRFTRENQPKGYFKDVIAKFKSKDKTLMLGEIYVQDDAGNWDTDHQQYAFEFPNYVKQGRTFTQIINDRSNDADKRLRIDKKSYAGYVTPMAIKITYSWPTNNGQPDNSHYATWAPTDATPFPVEAGGPDVFGFTKEWAIEIAKRDPAAWINRNGFPNVDPVDCGKWLYGTFAGEISNEPEIDLEKADLGQLLAVVEKNRGKKFPVDFDTSIFGYGDEEALRAVVIGVMKGEV